MAIGVDEFKHILKVLKQRFAEKKEYLIEMDSVIGDGDLGITMSKIFAAAADEAQESTEMSTGKLIMKSGMAMAKAAPSTMGTLMASTFMDAGKALKDKESIEIADWALFFGGMKSGIVKRGKTKVGEKTIFDVLSPVADYLLDKSYDSEKQLFEDITPFAASCLEKTKDMEAQHGKAACFGEKSRGHVDAGATVAYLLIETISEYFGATALS